MNGFEPAQMPEQMNVNEKGSLGLVKVAADLISLGYEVFLPFSGASAVDLIAADKALRLRRIQVKYRAANGLRLITVKLCTVVNGTIVPIDRRKIDGWAIYCPNTELVYYVPKSESLRKQFTINAGTEKVRGSLDSVKLQDPSPLWYEPRGSRSFRPGWVPTPSQESSM